jgi:hypothetical protein
VLFDAKAMAIESQRAKKKKIVRVRVIRPLIFPFWEYSAASGRVEN